MDIMNKDWVKRFATKLELFIATFGNVSNDKTIGNCMEQAIACAFHAASYGLCLGLEQALVFNSMESLQAWQAVWYHFQEHGFGPILPYPSWRKPVHHAATSMVERLQERHSATLMRPPMMLPIDMGSLRGAVVQQAGAGARSTSAAASASASAADTEAAETTPLRHRASQ